jgi:peroxiredoxin
MTPSDNSNPYELPAGLPVPEDDGACAHLPGTRMPEVSLQGIDGQTHELVDLTRARAVLYLYPATGVPGRDPAPGWDDIPGAPGCTVQSLGYRDRHAELDALGITVVGISAQDSAEQQEFARRTSIPFLLLSDPEFALHDCLGLPVFEAEGRRFYKRLAMVIEDGVIQHVEYPVFPPDRNAEAILDWIRGG